MRIALLASLLDCKKKAGGRWVISPLYRPVLSRSCRGRPARLYLALLLCVSLACVTAPPQPVPFVKLQAVQFQFTFYVDGVPTNPDNEITLVKGKTYQIQAVNADGEEVEELHGIQSISAIGFVGGALLKAGESGPVQTITPQTVGTFAFNCTNFCGQGHDGMVGAVHVVEP